MLFTDVVRLFAKCSLPSLIVARSKAQAVETVSSQFVNHPCHGDLALFVILYLVRSIYRYMELSRRGDGKSRLSRHGERLEIDFWTLSCLHEVNF